MKTEITIDLIDKRHIVVRSRILKNGAENHHFLREEETREFLAKLLKQYKKEGYEIQLEAKDAYKLWKD